MFITQNSEFSLREFWEYRIPYNVILPEYYGIMWKISMEFQEKILLNFAGIPSNGILQDTLNVMTVSLIE